MECFSLMYVEGSASAVPKDNRPSETRQSNMRQPQMRQPQTAATASTTRTTSATIPPSSPYLSDDSHPSSQSLHSMYVLLAAISIKKNIESTLRVRLPSDWTSGLQMSGCYFWQEWVGVSNWRFLHQS